jgi:hypothetical protein
MDKYWKYNTVEIVVLDDLDEIPEYVERTPSILTVSGDDQTLFEGQDSFDWLYKSIIELNTLPAPIKTKKEYNDGINTVDHENVSEPSFLSNDTPGAATKFGDTFGLKDNKKFDDTSNDVLAMFAERQEAYKPSENSIREG